MATQFDTTLDEDTRILLLRVIADKNRWNMSEYLIENEGRADTKINIELAKNKLHDGVYLQSVTTNLSGKAIKVIFKQADGILLEVELDDIVRLTVY